jgi:hypothetical protein
VKLTLFGAKPEPLDDLPALGTTSAISSAPKQFVNLQVDEPTADELAASSSK